MPRSVLPRVGGESKRKRRGGKKKDEMHSKGVGGCGFARAVGCRLLPQLTSSACSALSVVGTRETLCAANTMQSGDFDGPCTQSGVRFVRSDGMGASIRLSGQCASNLQRVQTDLSLPPSVPSSARLFPQARGIVDGPPSLSSVTPLSATDAADATGRRERLGTHSSYQLSDRLEPSDVCNMELTNRTSGMFCPLTDSRLLWVQLPATLVVDRLFPTVNHPSA